MGWNLGDVFAGIAQGVGSGMTMNAKNEIDTQNQMNMETRRAELDAKRTEAMARLNHELTEPDRKQAQANNERDYGLRDRQQASIEAYQKGILDDKSVQRTLTDQRNTAMAERDAAKLAGMGGAGGAGSKPMKLDQTLSDADKSYDANFYKQLETVQAPLTGGKPEEIAAKTAQLEKQRFARFGMKTEIDEGGGVTITDRTGYTKRFNSPEEAAQSGFKTKAVADAMGERAKQTEQQKEKPTPDANRIGGLPSPSKFNLMDMAPKSEEDQRAEALAVAYRFKGMSTDKLQAIIKSAKSADEKMAAEWAFVDAMSRGTDFANGGM